MRGERRPGAGRRLALAAGALALRATLLVSPRPGALLVRRAFAAGGAQTAASLARHAPPGVAVVRDERYGDEPGMLLDLHRPADADGPLPAIVWVHGGGWVGGSKEELAGWFALLASRGWAVVAPRYGLAPESRYPTPLRQVGAALAHVRDHADRLGVDATRFALAGDSAGAQIAAQTAALVTAPGYAEAVGVRPALAPEQLRAVVLACGPYDFSLLAAAADPVVGRFVRAVLWSYFGERRYAGGAAFAAASIPDRVTAGFPPALLTVGDGDPLRPHSELLAARLRAAGAEVETFFPAGADAPLGHEYQFDLDSVPAQQFLARMGDFLARRLAPDRRLTPGGG